jgi:hypothetical protein
MVVTIHIVIILSNSTILFVFVFVIFLVQYIIKDFIISILLYCYNTFIVCVILIYCQLYLNTRNWKDNNFQVLCNPRNRTLILNHCFCHTPQTRIYSWTLYCWKLKLCIYLWNTWHFKLTVPNLKAHNTKKCYHFILILFPFYFTFLCYSFQTITN